MNDIIKVENLATIVETSQYDKYSIEELTKIIATIEVKAFYIKGTLLKHIKENKRYKEIGYTSFGAYTKDVFAFSKTYADYLVKAINIYDNFDNLGCHFLPTEEKQIRPLAKLSEPEQVEIWQEVAKDKVPTAKEVQAAVNKRKNKESDKKVVKKDITTNMVPIEDFITVQEELVRLEQEVQELRLLKTLEKVEEKKEDTITISKKDFDELSNLAVAFMDMEIKLTNEINTLKCELEKYKPVEKEINNNELKREIAFNFIKKYGNDIQVLAITNQNPDNVRLYNLFDKVRQDYLLYSPPQSLPSNIINATCIIL